MDPQCRVAYRAKKVPKGGGRVRGGGVHFNDAASKGAIALACHLSKLELTTENGLTKDDVSSSSATSKSQGNVDEQALEYTGVTGKLFSTPSSSDQVCTLQQNETSHRRALPMNSHGKNANNFYRQGHRKAYGSNLSHGWVTNQDHAFKFDLAKVEGRQFVKEPTEYVKRNTESFKPSHEPPEMRILAALPGLVRYNRPITSRDVLIVHGLFCDPKDLTIYDRLLKEIELSGVAEEDLWQLWHGDTHVIADDRKRWKEQCPTFRFILEKVSEYFQLDIKATRLNWYRDSSEWKPFHHDAAAIKPDKAKEQNFTVAVSFGAERDVAFEHAKNKTVISMPQPNGTVYTFGRDVNIMWRHGILQVPPESYHSQGRISIIAWGWIPGMVDV